MAAVVADPDGGAFCRAEISGAAAAAEKLGYDLAERLLRGGADKILGASDRE
jgi:porphobilinogen deaminase